jgi:putative DNA primase/helicase
VGHAGPAFVRAIIGRTDLSDRLWVVLSQFGATEAQQLRGARIFAVAALAGELAVEAGILPWDKEEATKAAKIVFERWRDARAINSPGSTQQRVLESVSAFIHAHGESRFSALDPEEFANQYKTINRAGYVTTDERGNCLYLFSSSALREATIGIDFDQVQIALDKAGVLAKKEGKKKSALARTPRDGVQRFYWINPNKL